MFVLSLLKVVVESREADERGKHERTKHERIGSQFTSEDVTSGVCDFGIFSRREVVGERHPGTTWVREPLLVFF